MPAKPARRSSETLRQRLTAEQRRTQIVAATAQVVAAKGYANATLTEISQTAGVAKGLLWHYFADREVLMRETLKHLALRIREAVVGNIDLTAAAPQVIRAVLAGTARLTRTHPIELEAIDQIVHNLRSQSGSQRITMRDYDSIYAEHIQLLARGQSEGFIREGDVQVMAVSYQGIIDAMIGYLQAHPEVDDRQQSTAVADLFLSGVTTESRAPLGSDAAH
jgi:AcrR family transcriptional regulator